MTPHHMTIVTLTATGLELAKKLSGFVSNVIPSVEILHKPKPFAEIVQQRFKDGHCLLFICSTGIVFRTLAPVLVSKYEDPAIIALSEDGRYIIPLLSGHEGGANALASELAEYLQAQLVLTTASDYTQPVFTVGMGCERGCSSDELESLLENCLKEANITLAQVESISSIDIKADENGLLQLSKNIDRPFRTWSVDNLSTMESLLSQKSDYVYQTVGVYGVAESAALYAAKNITGNDPELQLNKKKTQRATCAIARSYY